MQNRNEGEHSCRKAPGVSGQNQYDCVVGLGGGKDSSYIIHRLKNHYGANVLAFTCDNGFLNDYALDFIRTVVDGLGVDHLWVKLPDELLRRLYRGSMLAEGLYVAEPRSRYSGIFRKTRSRRSCRFCGIISQNTIRPG